MRPGLIVLARCGGLLAAILMAASPAHAQRTDTQNETVNFVVAAQAKLALSWTTQTFPNADPDTVSQIPSSEGPITITAKGRSAPGSQIILSVLASGDLQAGMNVIGVAALTWTGTGTGFAATGAANKTLAQQVALWSTSGTFAGTQTYFLANSWSYAVGAYGVTLTYTLSAP